MEQQGGPWPRFHPDAWARISGLYVTLGVLVTVELVRRMAPGLADPAPFVLVAVVYATFVGGVAIGMMSGIVGLAYWAALFAAPGDLLAFEGPGVAVFAGQAVATLAMVGMVGLLKERERHANGRAEAAARLEELDALKTQFINNAAHELRTPLTPIKMQMHVLRMGDRSWMDERQRRAFDMVGRNIDRLNLLVQDLLEVARLQAGKLPVHPRPVELRALAAETVDAFRENAMHGGVHLELADGPDVHVTADGKRVLQVLYNLVGNALKFTPAGGEVVVHVAAAEREGVVRVADTGVGLHREDAARLFLPFSQIQDPHSTKTPGSGLGLYICRGLLEQQGGRIWCDSLGPGRGSTFAFTLPLTGSDGAAAQAGPAQRLGLRETGASYAVGVKR